MDLGLRGRYALVTGGSRGIGLAIAGRLADEGCHVAICAREAGFLTAAERTLRDKGVEVLAVQADGLGARDSARGFAAAIARGGTRHVLENKGGGGGGGGSPVVEETTEDVWTDVYAKNAGAAVRFTVRAIPFMRRQKWGRVVTIASVHGLEAGGRPWFTMAKSAEIALMKSLALTKDLVRDGITFNTVAPGAVMISKTGWEAERERDPVAFDRMVDERYPLGRLGRPDEVANVVAFVCSEPASWLNGAAIAVDGGESRRF